MVTQEVCTRALHPEEAMNVAMLESTLEEKREEIAKCFPDVETYEFAQSLEEKQKSGRNKRKRGTHGNYVRYGETMKRVSKETHHSAGVLAKKRIDLWRPWPTLRRKHLKRKLEHFHEDTLLLDLHCAQVAGKGHGGSDVFKRFSNGEQSRGGSLANHTTTTPTGSRRGHVHGARGVESEVAGGAHREPKGDRDLRRKTSCKESSRWQGSTGKRTARSRTTSEQKGAKKRRRRVAKKAMA